MARKAPGIDTLTKRKNLPPRPEPYWRKIREKQYLGFRRNKSQAANDDYSGPWIARLTNGNLRHSYENLGHGLTFEEASDKALKWFEQVAGAADRHYLVKDAVRDYVKSLRINNSLTASKETEQRLDKHLIPSLGDVELFKLSTAQVSDWRDSMVKVSDDPEIPDDPEVVRRSKDTANRVLNMAKAAFNLAFYSDIVKSNDAWKKVKPFSKVSQSRILFLTDAQVQRLLKKTSGSFHALIKADVMTGARYGELAGVKVSDFDSAQGTLTLRGKTGKRECYLSNDALQFFKAQTKNKLPAAWILTNDGTPWGKNHHTRLMKEAIKNAKLPRDTVFYSLRHYYISKACLAGIPLNVIAENCGTSVKMIEKYYAKFLPKDRKSMLDSVSLAG